MLSIDNLEKRYGDHIVFKGLSHSFQAGCFALCEEDSTGKSTLLNMIAGLVMPDDGDIFINGHSVFHQPVAAKAALAFIPDNCLRSPEQTGREFLEQTAMEKQAPIDAAVLDLARRFALEPHLDKRFEQMSTGMRRKVYLTAAALGKPAVIVADGPSNGLDAHACQVLAEQFKIWGQDRVVLFASHDPELVEFCGAQTLALRNSHR